MRKTLLTVVLILLLPVMALAQTWVTANQGTVAWDAVAPIATGDVIKYQVYTRPDLTSAGAKVGTEITATQLTITFPSEGKYYVGVQTLRYPTGETSAVTSAIGWSSDPAVCSPAGPFGFKYFVIPGVIKNMRVP